MSDREKDAGEAGEAGGLPSLTDEEAARITNMMDAGQQFFDQLRAQKCSPWEIALAVAAAYTLLEDNTNRSAEGIRIIFDNMLALCRETLRAGEQKEKSEQHH